MYIYVPSWTCSPSRIPGTKADQPPRNNMALCDLKRQEWGRAVETTSEILQRNAKNTKVGRYVQPLTGSKKKEHILDNNLK